MRKSITASVFCCVSLVACGYRRHSENDQERQREAQQQTDETARKAGHAAYEATQKAEQAAKQLGHDVKSASEQAQKGWDDAKREHEAKKQTEH